MRALCVPMFAILSACATAPAPESGNTGTSAQYRLTLYRWNGERTVEGKGVANADLATAPDAVELSKLLREAKSDNLQIYAQCEVERDRFHKCRELRVSPKAGKLAEHAASFLATLQIARGSLAQSTLPPNQATVQMTISANGRKRRFGDECILPSFCGAPTPRAPLPPKSTARDRNN